MTIRLDTTPYWTDTTPVRRFPKLSANERADVVVIGSGITGLTAAYLCAAVGASVVVLERDAVASVDTGHTSAHLTMVTDTRLTDLVSSLGRDHARAVWDAGLASIAQIQHIIVNEAIECDFDWVAGYLYAHPDATAEDLAALESEAQLADTLGFDATFVSAVPLTGRPGIRFDRQARFHAGKYARGLADAIVRRGGRIFEHSGVEEFMESPRGVKVNGATVTADFIVIATHTPLTGDRSLATATLMQTKLALYSTYVVAGTVKKGSLPDVLLWDTGDPYHYYRLQPDQDDVDVVIYGGADHKTGQADDTAKHYARLEASLGDLIPGVAISHRWSGQVVEPADGLPFIGEIAPREFAGTGYSGNGMTFGTLTAMMAHDAWTGRANPWRDLFSPSRSIVRGGVWDYLAENKDYPYYLIRDRFAGAEGRALRSIEPGTARIIARNGKPTAVYRDEGGGLTMCSALCTHMGCLVAWNKAERTWDCPCHGSRFTPEGAVISGPAERPLAESS